ncbi:tetratricopeptide repeat protein [Myxococcus sp. K15C18031901]|uniref:tetratricopeptide repeat protein n=1 Tax=Myxococcus dinghuensis TaxID=2906761 RepID=UPI0020A6F221|nr:tetratricopeptide repeat protein [Myxococcus dinghuensis]MCP3102304.1 tetratricopeptide repeat protein [Myxococcus dinghuensis]
MGPYWAAMQPFTHVGGCPWWKPLGLVLALAWGCNRGAAGGETPFTPGSDSQVLERVPATATDPRARERAALRRELDANPRQLDLATRLARLEVEAGRARGDPRHLGWAQAALGPWWDAPEPPHEVRLLRATIRQGRHEFDAALEDLEAAVREDPADAQSWLTRAVVLGVRGRHAEAARSCGPLEALVGELPAAVCRAQVDSLSGHSRRAYARLSQVLASRARAASPREQAWGLSTLGEAAARAGDVARAEVLYSQALSADPDDAYTRAAFADLLLDLGRPREVARLMEAHSQDDGQLLRRVLAETALGTPEARVLAEELAARHAASRLRGDSLHAREEARFALHVERDADKALSLALENWRVQREPWDVRVLLEAALAARRPEAARPALDFLASTDCEDPGLVALARQLEEAAP